MNVLLIKDGIVENCISADSVERAQQFYPAHICMEQTASVGPGYTYVSGVFTAPTPVVKVEDCRITQYAFLTRFTDEEAIGIDLASQGATVQAAAMRRQQKKIDAASFIDLSDPTTRGGVEMIEAYGLIGAGRAAVILDEPVQDKERYVP
jgi:hypothetical protein